MIRIRTSIREGGPSINHILGFDVTGEELESLQKKGLVSVSFRVVGRADIIQQKISSELEREVPPSYKYLS